MLALRKIQITPDLHFAFAGCLLLMLILLQGMVAFAEVKPLVRQDVQIFEVRKKLQMKSTDPIIRDYYVNAGQVMGLKAGANVQVSRNVPLSDPNNQEAQTHMELPVGTMKIIYANRTMSIGRFHSLAPSQENPILDNELFMVGDKVNLGSIGFDREDDKPIDKVAAALKETPEKKEEEKPELKVDIKADIKPEAKAEVKTEAKAEPKVETKPESKGDKKIDNKTENKPEVKLPTAADAGAPMPVIPHSAANTTAISAQAPLVKLDKPEPTKNVVPNVAPPITDQPGENVSPNTVTR